MRDENLTDYERYYTKLTRDTAEDVSGWGGKRPGAGAKKQASPNAKRRTFLLTDDEHEKIKEYIRRLRLKNPPR